MVESPYARLKRGRAFLKAGDAKSAQAVLSEIVHAIPRELEASRLLARALTERAQWDAALEAARHHSGPDQAEPGGGDVERVAVAEVLIAAGRFEEARRELEPADPSNIVAQGLLAALTHLAPGDPDSSDEPQSDRAYPGERAAFFFEPVVAVVLLLLELRLESRLRGKPSPELEAARIAFLRPGLHASEAPCSRPGWLDRARSALRNPRGRERERRGRAVYQHFRQNDAETFQAELERWLADDPDRPHDRHDHRSRHLLEVVFLRHRFDEFLTLARRYERHTLEDPGMPLRIGHAKMALGRVDEAARSLRKDKASLDSTGAYLLARAELASGHPERALAWFRRAFAMDDIATVDAATALLGALG